MRVIVCGWRGTADMTRRARAAGVDIIEAISHIIGDTEKE